MDRPTLRAALAVAALFAAACSPGADDAPSPAADTVPGPEAAPAPPPADGSGPVAGPGVSAEEARAVARTAQPVAAALMQTLSGNLMAAMEEGGPVAAMDFCQVEALPLTRQVTEERGMEVKRTSWRVRNPANAPDALEEAALAHFADASAAQEGVPSPWVQADPQGGFRFYRPLPTGALCVNCHGAPDRLADGVSEALARLYPDDRAVGFAEGELRGLLRVSVPASALDPGDDRAP